MLPFLLDDARRGRPVARWGRARRWLRSSAAVLVLTLAAGPVGVLGGAAPAAAATDPFAPVFSANTHGSILLAANTLMTCEYSAECQAARATTSAGDDNDDFVSRFVDSDGDTSTFNSSWAKIAVPTGGTVLFSALVWGGRTTGTAELHADPALADQVRLTVPAGTGTESQTLTASTFDVGADHGYRGYVEVTDLVALAGSGKYTVADVQSSIGGADGYAGWSLVVVVADPYAPARNLTVLSGYGDVQPGGAAMTMEVDGFRAASSGTVAATLGTVVLDGDAGQTGDQLWFDGTAVADALNPADNTFNSTISARGAKVGNREPAYVNQLGFDADQLAVDGVLANGATSATVSFTSTADTYHPALVTLATDLDDPALVAATSVRDLNGGGVAPGDVLIYTVTVRNKGLGTAVGSTFFDAIPTGTTFVPGSILVDREARTDAADARDAAQYVPGATGGGHVLVHLGTGATSEAGGAIPVSATTNHTIAFRVTVDATVTNGQGLTNAAVVTYRGQTFLQQASVVAPPVVSVVSSSALPTATAPTATLVDGSFTPAPAARTVRIPVLDGDSAADGGAVRVVALTDPAGGSVTLQDDGTVVYAPRDDFAGTDVFTYTIADAAGNLATASVPVTVRNTAPTATPDTATVRVARTSAVDVLSNDLDPNGDVLAVLGVAATSARGGTVELRDGTVEYTPAVGFHGVDSISYVVIDARGASASGTAGLTVVNSSPVAVADTVEALQDTRASLAVLGNDTDDDGDTVTVTPGTGPGHGTLVLEPDGTGTYTPDPGFAGTDTFTYTVTDPYGDFATATVTVLVDGPPTAVDDVVTTPADTPVAVDVLGNDTDPDGDRLTVASTSAPAHGSAEVLADGTVRYTPAAGWAGPDSFGYVVADGRGLSGTGVVTVTVANAEPVARPDAVGTPAGTPVAGIDVLANDTDPNVEAGVPGQVLSLSGIPVADHGATVTVQAGGTLTVTPAPGYRGPVTVTYRVDDGAGGTATGILTVTVANAVPVAVRDVAVTGYRQAVEVAVLRNDTDANTGDVLRVAPGSLGTPVDAAGRAQGSVVLRDGILTYTPPTGFSGAVTFTYDVTDGTARATGDVSVTVRNAAPVAAVDVARVPAGTTVTIDALRNDTDPDGGVLTILRVSQPSSGSVAIVDNRLVYEPAPDYSGAVAIEYVLGDGQGGESTAVVTLEVLGRAVAGPTGLARTGAATGATAALAALLLATGTGLVLAGRRRRG